MFYLHLFSPLALSSVSCFSYLSVLYSTTDHMDPQSMMYSGKDTYRQDKNTNAFMMPSVLFKATDCPPALLCYVL